MKNLFKYLPLLMDILPHLSSITDEENPIEKKADHVLQILGVLADETDTDLDDILVDRVRELVATEEFWDTIEMIVDYFKDGEPKEVGSLLQEERNLNPATIALIIEVVGLIVRLWRDRK